MRAKRAERQPCCRLLSGGQSGWGKLPPNSFRSSADLGPCHRCDWMWFLNCQQASRLPPINTESWRPRQPARSFANRCPSGLVVLFFVVGLTARGDIVIDRALVDGREGAVPAGDPPALRLPAGARRLDIQVRGDARMRYRLDGFDDQWRDWPAKARVLLQFTGRDGFTIDSFEMALSGTSSGWAGSPEASPMKDYSLAAVAPPLAVRAAAVFLSHGGDEVVGEIGIDNVAFTVASNNGGDPKRVPYSVVLGDKPFNPLANATGRGRPRQPWPDGRAPNAQRSRPAPDPRPYRQQPHAVWQLVDAQGDRGGSGRPADAHVFRQPFTRRGR